MAIQGRYLFGHLLCCLALIAASLPSCTAYDFAKWTFDSHDGMTVTPEDNSESNFVGDLTPLGSDISSILVPGVHNKSLYVNGKSFNLATGLGSTCMRDIAVCGDSEWGFSFWLKIMDWNNATDPVIFRTTNLEKSDAGIYVGRGEGDTVMVFLRGSDGFSVFRSFSQTPLWNQWGHVTITTSRRPTTTLEVRVNGTRVGRKISIRSTSRGSELMPADFVVGAENGPTFYLDDLNIQYHDSLTTSSATTTSSTATTTTTTTTATTTTTTTTQQPTTLAITEPVATSTMTNVPTESTNTNSIVPAGSRSNIWIPISIAILVALLILCCLFWILCVRRRKSRRDMENQVGVRYTDVQSGYARTSTIAPYQDDVGSNQDTEDNQTDQEEQGGRLLPGTPSS